MSKAQLCSAAQPFCDELMEANYHQGRMRGAWSSITTLEKHGLVSVHKAGVAWNDQAGGLRALGSNSYRLTPDGALFTEALIQRHGDEVKRQIKAAGGGAAPHRIAAGPGSLAAGSLFDGVLPIDTLSHRTNVPFAPQLVLPGNKITKYADGFEQDLRMWAESASIGEQKTFNVGKQRRQRLHNVCDALNMNLRLQGRQLRHESVSTSSRSRTLYVTVVPATSSALTQPNPWPMLDAPDEIDDTVLPWMPEQSPPRQRLYSAIGHTLGGTETDTYSVTPPKRSRVGVADSDTKLPPKVAAAEAAMLRQALFESSQVKKPAATASVKIPKSTRTMPPVLCIDGDEDEGNDASLEDAPVAKLPPKEAAAQAAMRRHATHESSQVKPISTIIKISDSPPTVARARNASPAHLRLDEDDDAPRAKVAAASKHGLVGGSSALVVDLTSDDEAKQNQDTLAASPRAITIVIDHRERNRNATPRVLRTELQRILTAGPLQQVWPVDLPPAVVKESKLTCGDFSILDTPVAVERKRISDLVQRSVRNPAHWKQLQLMREMGKQAFFLLEGSVQSAGQFQAFGLTDEATTESSFAVYNDESLVRFVGRSILLSKTKFIQSRDEQGSLRAVASLALMACSLGNCQMNEPLTAEVDVKRQRNEVIQRLDGIPEAIANRVAEVIGSCGEMDRLYNALPTDSIRDLVLEPVISDSIKEVPENTCSAADWSMACHQVFRSRAVAPVTGAFKSVQTLVTNPAKLLAELHKGKATNVALDDVLEDPSSILLERRVHIALPEEYGALLRDCFPYSDDAFYRATIAPALEAPTPRTCLPSIVFWTKLSGLGYRSDNVYMYVLEGTSLVARIEDSLSSGKGCFVETVSALVCEVQSRRPPCLTVSLDQARSLARDVCLECGVCDCKWDKDCALCVDSKSRQYQRTVVLVRALYGALERRAKQPGYRAEIRAVADLVLSDLMLARDMVVLQAVRKDADMKLFVSQFALASFHFQLITRTSDVLKE
jgi:ERCC4-type nuclease